MVNARRLTFVNHISQISHTLNGVVVKRICPTGEDLLPQLVPDSPVPSEHKEGKSYQASGCIACRKKHIDNLITQYDGVLGSFSQFVDKDVVLFRALVEAFFRIQSLLPSERECFCNKLVGIGMYLCTRFFEFRISMDKHEGPESQAINDAFLSNIKSIVE